MDVGLVVLGLVVLLGAWTWRRLPADDPPPSCWRVLLGSRRPK